MSAKHKCTGSSPVASFIMNEQEKIENRLKELAKQSRIISAEIKRLRKLKKAVSPQERINWNVIAFQERIYHKIWDWASPHSRSKQITLAAVKRFIANLPKNEKKVAASLQEIEKLEKLTEDVAIKKARGYINNKYWAIHRNGNRWIC